MKLTEDEAQFFYKLWTCLLDYTNKKYDVVPFLKDIKNAWTLNPQRLIPIKNKLWEDKNLINEYLYLHSGLHCKNEIEILESWKRRIEGRFIIVKHLKKYTIFMSSQNEIRLYGVIGISNPIETMFDSTGLPILVEAVLLPFGDRIIYDSLLLPFSVSFGSGAKKGISNDYKMLKEQYGIVTTL
jgi:hypothetical protein